MGTTLTVGLDLLDAAVGRPAAVSVVILLLQRRTDAPLDRVQPEHTHTRSHDRPTGRTFCVWQRRSDSLAGGHGGGAVGSIRPAVAGPLPAGAGVLLPGLQVLCVGLDAVALGVAAGVHGCTQTDIRT